MLPITNKFTYCMISPRLGTKIGWIVIHYFGSLGSALNTAAWFANPANHNGSADFCVDDDYIIRCNPDFNKYYTWHCGGGLQGYIRHSKYGICRNINSIGIEMRPYNENGNVQEAQNAGWYFHKKTIDNTVDLVHYLMKKFDIPADHVIMHADVTGKYCPAPFLDNISQWDAFVAAVKGTHIVVPSTPTEQASKKLYRVRKTWADAAGQIGAFIALENAKAMVDQNPGYKVFDNSGDCIYPKAEADSFKVRVSVKDLRIRRGPGLGYPAAGYISPGVYTIVATEESDGYIFGKLKSGAGWIALDFTRKL